MSSNQVPPRPRNGAAGKAPPGSAGRSACLPNDRGEPGELLDMLGIAACRLDADERLLGWNETYERFFPEQHDLLVRGLPYIDNLRRYVDANHGRDRKVPGRGPVRVVCGWFKILEPWKDVVLK